MQEQKEAVQEKITDQQKLQVNDEEIKQSLNSKESEIKQQQNTNNQGGNNNITERNASPPKLSSNVLIDNLLNLEQTSLSSAKKLQRQIEQDQKILYNRIELLELEKSKMDKNIKLTNHKTSQILSMKLLHLNKQKTSFILNQKELTENTQQQFREFLSEKIKERKRDKNERIKQTLQKHKQKQRELILEMKNKNKNYIQQQKQFTLQNHKQLASQIRQFKEMRKNELNKLRENQLNLAMKENQLEIQKISKQAAQYKLNMLEKEKREQNLMMQLQKSQEVQKNALEKLENAFTMPFQSLEDNIKNQLIELPKQPKPLKLKKSKTQNKIKLQQLPAWNSSTVLEKNDKSSFASFQKYREKMLPQANYQKQLNNN